MADRSGSGDLQHIVRSFGLASLGYSALVLLLFHGLIGQFSTAVPHDLGDPLLSTWILWWNAHHLPFVGTWWDGLSFYPGHGSLAFSDHRVGLELLAGPVQWLGGTPVLAYNVTLLSSFVLSALGAHALTWTLTKNHAAGAVSGLIFGFNPFRISHIAHLELLVAFWLPLALVALHLYVRRFEKRWLYLFAALWALQGLSSGYYLFYSAPVVGLWTLWFARDKPWRAIAAMILACGIVFLAFVPVFLRYRVIQDQLFLTRGFGEIEVFSADVTGLLSATPIMALWRVPSLAQNGEGEIYLGIFAPLLVLAAVLWRGRASGAPLPPRWHVWRLGLALLCASYALIAVGTLFGSWSVSLGPVTVSVSRTDRPLSVAILSLLVLGITSPTFVNIFRRRSTFAFYTIAAVMTWLFTLGPRPRLLGHVLLYRGPYALLMLFPGFDDRLRVPARFVMITILAVAIAAGIALLRLTASASRTVRVVVTALVLAAITTDSWTLTCPIQPVPAFLSFPKTVPDAAAVLELPLGGVGPDIAAVYRSIAHGHPVVNGYSGYDPPHYRVLRAGLEARDDSVLTTLTTFAPIAVVIAREDDPTGAWATFVERHEGTERLEQTRSHTFYLLPASRSDALALDGLLTIRRGTSNAAQFDLKAVTDDNFKTAWGTPTPQHGGEEVVLEFDDVRNVSGLSLSTGSASKGYPRWLTVATSVDGETWEDVWGGGVAGAALEGALKDPRTMPSRITFPAKPGRFVRLRQLRASYDGWVIAELAIYGTMRSSS